MLAPILAAATVFHAYPDERCVDFSEIQLTDINSPIAHACQRGGESLQACIASLHQPGDECRLHAGHYFVQGDPLQIRGLHGTSDAPFIIAAYSEDEGEVVIDGTAPATTQPWKRLGVSVTEHVFVAGGVAGRLAVVRRRRDADECSLAKRTVA